MSGRLFIIATPLGNLGDLTVRAKETLDSCELVLAEDTRVSIKILNYLGLKKKLVSCHEFNESQRLELLDDLARHNKNVALVCDAGTPLISDPGTNIVRKAIALGMQAVPVPGPSAFLLALVGSGLDCSRFAFEGFLPERRKKRKMRLAELAGELRTLIFYVAPHDLSRVLPELIEAFGDRQACLARELTKVHEQFVRGSLKHLSEVCACRAVRGECVLVVAGASPVIQKPAAARTVMAALKRLMKDGRPLKQASAEVAARFGWRRAQVYKLGLEQSRTKQSGS